MERMKFETPDLVAGNVEKIGALFPNCITEALDEEKSTPEKKVYKKAVNFELLKQMLSPEALAGDEAYEFTWVGKKAAIVEANKPIRATLRPCPEESVNWDTTENLYIEGDNLQVLKLLQESYLGKVKMIYIDPPYNTGNDFIYQDNFTADSEGYKQEQGLFNEDENRLFHNTDTNGRFHSDWCSMIYSRLFLARNLLSSDGVIYISIDDNEVENLRKITDEVFGADNFVSSIIWEKKYAPANDAKWLSDNHDFLLLYAKNKDIWRPKLLPRSDEMNSRYTNRDNDPRGPWKAADMTVKSYSESYDYPITTPSGRTVYPAAGRCWNTSKGNFEKLVRDNRIWFGEKGDNVPAVKTFLSEVKDGMVPTTIWKYTDVGHNQEGRQEVKRLFDGKGLFDGPKPIRLLHRALQIANTKEDDIVLDFFSGSATTAHAMMRLNAEDGGHRKFIMVQLPEKCDESSEAYKAGYRTICDIGKERIRRAGRKIQEEAPLTTQNLDIGFRVLKLDSSNMKDVYYAPGEVSQAGLLDMVSNIKEDRSALDLLFGCLLEWNLPLSLPYRSESIDGCTVHTYNDGDLIACFDKDIPDSVIREIARRKPLRAVFRDDSFADSPAKINVFELFKLLAPDARVKVI